MVVKKHGKPTATRGQGVNENYFSGSQASLFIGDIWVDDILAIDYSVQHVRTPQYGYGSQHWDFLPAGAITVGGTFTINFREPNYLWLILERYKKFNGSKGSREKVNRQLDAELKALSYPGDKRKRAQEFFNVDNPSTAKESLIAQAREWDGLPEPDTGENMNHVSFDILLGYGYELGPDTPGETIKDVHILGKSKVVNADGRPIQERYEFIARRLV